MTAQFADLGRLFLCIITALRTNGITKSKASDTSDIKQHIAPIIRPKNEDELARRFDHLVYSIELGILQSKNINKAVKIVVDTAGALSLLIDKVPQVTAQKEIIRRVQVDEFWGTVSLFDLEEVRTAMRDLLQYLPKTERVVYYTEFSDILSEPVEGTPIFSSDEFKNYQKKVEFYLKEHSDIISVYKLKHNKKLTEADLKELERVLWTELGSKSDYEKEYGQTPIGKLVRKIVGVEREAVNEAFSEFLSEERLNINQIRFVQLIIDYIVVNGNIDDNKVFMEEPFRSVGSITELFRDDMGTAKQILNIVEIIRSNSEDIA